MSAPRCPLGGPASQTVAGGITGELVGLPPIYTQLLNQNLAFSQDPPEDAQLVNKITGGLKFGKLLF